MTTVGPWVLPVLCALLAAGAVGLLIRGPTHTLGRVLRSPAETAIGPARRALAGRPDAAPLPRRLMLGAVAAAAAVVTVSVLAGEVNGWFWTAAPLLAAAVVWGLGWLEPTASRRRRLRLVADTPQALELMAAALQAGLPVRNACAAVVEAFSGPVAEDLGRVLALTGLGLPDADAWRSLSAHPQLGPAAVDLAQSVESGLRMVETLRHHSRLARERQRSALQVVARSVGVRSVLPLMTCFIPAFMLLGVLPAVVSALQHAFR